MPGSKANILRVDRVVFWAGSVADVLHQPQQAVLLQDINVPFPGSASAAADPEHSALQGQTAGVDRLQPIDKITVIKGS